jgi:hypothetical protein
MGKGQSGKQDYRGAYSGEVPGAPAEKTGGKAFGRGQGWHGPYTDNSPPARSAYPVRHDEAGNPVAGSRGSDAPDANDGYSAPLPKR